MRPLLRIARLQTALSRNLQRTYAAPAGVSRESSEQAMPLGPYYESILAKINSTREATPKPVAEAKPQPVQEAKPQVVDEEKPQPVKEIKSQQVEEVKPQPTSQDKPQPVEEVKPQPVREDKPKPSREDKPKPTREDKDNSSREDRPKPTRDEKDKPSREEKPKPTREDKDKSSREDKPKPSREDRDKSSREEKKKPRQEVEDKPRREDKQKSGREEKYKSSREDKDDDHHSAKTARSAKKGSKPKRDAPSARTAFSEPGTTTSTSSTPIPQQTPAEPTAQEKARIIFGSRLAGPAERADRLQSIRDRSTLIAGISVPPRPEEPENCCMSGCVNCVWDLYRDEMEEWAAASSLAKQAKQQTERAQELGSPSADVKDIPVSSASSSSTTSMDDDGGGSEANWQTAKTDHPQAWDDDLYNNVPVGIREFMKHEKKLKEKHKKEGTFGG